MPLPVDVRPGAPERLARMVQLPTVSAELEQRGLRDFAAFRQLLAEEYPLLAATLEFEQVGDLGLLYRWRGTGDGDPVILMAHYDVVPAVEADGWTVPPFEGRIAEGIVWGRGTLDDKGPLLVLVEAVENLLAAGFTPPRDVYLSFGGDEESHGRAARGIADLFRERGITPWLVVDEGGAVVDAPLPFVPVAAAMVGVGEKGVLTLRLTARTGGGHASAPAAHTAVSRVARAVDRLTRRQFPARMSSSVREMLAAFVPHATGRSRALLRTLVALPPVTARVFAGLGGEPAAIVRTTVAPTMLSGGTAHNVLPPEASAILNLRIALGETVESATARVRRVIRDPEIEVTVVEGSEPSPESPVDDDRFRAIAAAVEVAYPGTPTAPYVMMAATDSRWFHRFSPAVYRFAPLAMTAEQRATVHGVDEHVTIDSLERGEAFHRALITSIPGVPG